MEHLSYFKINLSRAHFYASLTFGQVAFRSELFYRNLCNLAYSVISNRHSLHTFAFPVPCVLASGDHDALFLTAYVKPISSVRGIYPQKFYE